MANTDGNPKILTKSHKILSCGSQKALDVKANFVMELFPFQEQWPGPALLRALRLTCCSFKEEPTGHQWCFQGFSLHGPHPCMDHPLHVQTTTGRCPPKASIPLPSSEFPQMLRVWQNPIFSGVSHQTVKADLSFKVWGFPCQGTESLQPRAASHTGMEL